MNSSKNALYLSEYSNDIRKITLPGYVVTTLAGGGGAGHSDQAGSGNSGGVQFLAPTGMVIDASDNLIITEYTGHYLRYINISGGLFNYSLTLAGNGSTAYASGVGANGLMTSPTAVALDIYGNPWVVGNPGSGNTAIWNYNIQTGYLNLFYQATTTVPKPINVQNTALSTIVAPAIATGTIYGSGYTITNYSSVNPGGATYTAPNGVAVDSQNNVYVGDQYKIRKISPSGVVTSIYGDPSNTQNALFNGTGANSQTANVYGMCFDNSGNMYFTTTLNATNYVVTNISRLNLTTYAVTPLVLTGQTSISNPRGILFDGSNTLYVACQNLGKSGYVVTVNINTGACVIIAGSLNGPQAESNNATGTSATFNNLLAICFDPAKQNLYTTSNGGSIRKISLTAPYPVTTPSITGLSFSNPRFIACDPFGNLFVTLGTSVVKVVISTLVASTFNSLPYTDLQGIAIDTYNNVYVCDFSLKSVYYINPSGSAVSYSGVSGTSGTQDSTYASSITLMAPYVGINTANPTSAVHVTGAIVASGSITGASKNFKIPHPVLSNNTLIHASIEGPRYDLIYRNRKQLVNGSAEVDIEKESTSNGATMTAGTFDALATNADVFLQNNETFDRVKGYVSSHMLFIESENSNSSAFINWMVVAERHDPHVIDSEVTDASGFLVLERSPVSQISTVTISTEAIPESTHEPPAPEQP